MSWSTERRRKQAEMIRQWKPWEKSTGPRTAEGKARASRNACKGSVRLQLKEISAFLARLEADRERLITSKENPADAD